MVTSGVKHATLSGAGLAFMLALAHFANDAYTNVLPVFLPMLQVRLGVGEVVLATFVAVLSLSANVMQAFVGALADRWGRRRCAAVGLIAGSTLMSLVAVAPNVASLFLILLVGGIGSAIFHPAAVSMAGEVGSRKSLAVGLFSAGGPLGVALMPIVILAVIRSLGPQYVPYLAVFGVGVGLLLLYLAPRQTPVARSERAKVFDAALFAGPVGQLTLAGLLRAIAFICFSNAVPLYLTNVRGFAPDAQIIGYTLGLFSAMGAIGGLIAGAMESLIGRRRIVMGAMLIGMPLMVGVLFAGPGTFQYYALVALAGFMNNSPIPLMVVAAQELAPHALGTASGMLMGFTWGSAGVIYIGFGALQQAIGLTPAILIGFSFLLPGALLAGHVIGRHAPRAVVVEAAKTA